jgi:hypothetical protein
LLVPEGSVKAGDRSLAVPPATAASLVIPLRDN